MRRLQLFMSFLLVLVVGPSLLQGSSCVVQQSPIPVSVGEQFTVGCTHPCAGYSTIFWLNQDDQNIFTVLPRESITRTPPTASCGSPGVDNITQQLTILVTEELRTISEIQCWVAFDNDPTCMASAGLEVEDQVTTGSDDDDDDARTCAVEQVIDVGAENDRLALNCTVPCDISHETILWLATDPETNSKDDLFDVVPEERVQRVPSSGRCSTPNTTSVTYGVQLLVSNHSLPVGSVLCIASLRGGGQMCVLSAIIQNTKAPSPPSTGTTTLPTLSPPPTESSSTPLPATQTTDSSSLQQLSNSLLVMVFMSSLLFL